MKTSLKLELEDHFGPEIPEEYRAKLKAENILQNAERKYYQKNNEYAIFQEYDGRDAILYQLEIRIDKSTAISMKISERDIHGIVCFSGKDTPKISHADSGFECTLIESNFKHLYLPCGDYTLHLHRGSYKIFGYYLRGGQFRNGNEKNLQFLHQILADFITESQTPSETIPIKIDKFISSRIAFLCQHLQKGDITHDTWLLNSLFDILKLLSSTAKQNSRTVNEDFAEKIKIWIDQNVEKRGRNFNLAEFGTLFNKKPQFLNHAFKSINNMTMREYKNKMVVEKIKALVMNNESLISIVDQYGFNDLPHLSSFFKKQEKVSITAFRKLNFQKNKFT